MEAHSQSISERSEVIGRYVGDMGKLDITRAPTDESLFQEYFTICRGTMRRSRRGGCSYSEDPDFSCFLCEYLRFLVHHVSQSPTVRCLMSVLDNKPASTRKKIQSGVPVVRDAVSWCLSSKSVELVGSRIISKQAPTLKLFSPCVRTRKDEYCPFRTTTYLRGFPRVRL